MSRAESTRALERCKARPRSAHLRWGGGEEGWQAGKRQLKEKAEENECARKGDSGVED